MEAKPRRTRAYRCATLDSSHWDSFEPRTGDIVISTSMKAGTTWMQRICAALIFGGPELDRPMDEISPWLDQRMTLPARSRSLLEGQQHRRFIKSHLPLNALRFFDQVSYIVVCRDARDVFMSMVNHHRNRRSDSIARANARTPEELLRRRDRDGLETSPEERQQFLTMQPWEGVDVPVLADADVHEYWRLWLSRSVYPWEHDGYPYWSHFTHLASWWPWRHLPNILFVHYDDLLADTDGQMRRLAEWLGIPVDEKIWPAQVRAVSFQEMKREFSRTAPLATNPRAWQNAENFFHKGQSGQWRDVLGEKELALYDKAADRVLSPTARRWMERGSLASADPRQLDD